MHTGRLIGSILLNDTTFVLAAISIASIVAVVSTGRWFALLGLAPPILAVGSFVIRRLTKSLRYTIAGTADGVRIGYGLLTTSNETLPPGRIHSVQVSQPILWRGFGWWEVKVNTASKSSNRGADGQANTTILPVGNLGDVLKVLALVLPGMQDDASKELLRAGLLSKGGADGFTNSPRRAVGLRWFSWRRNGFADGNGIVLFRKGAIWRKLVIVPQARVQSTGLHQGPLERALGLAVVRLHTVAGPISAHLGAVDRDEAIAFFERVSLSVIEVARTDTSHRWRSGEAPA
jgi:putative membrane protein